MITTRGQVIEIDGKTEWLLFHRLSKRINPVDFLSQVDSYIQFPNFLYSLSLLILMATPIRLWIKFAIPSGFYFIGYMMVNYRFGIGVFKLLKFPLLFYPKFSYFILMAAFVTCFFLLGGWSVLFIPAYLLTVLISIFILTSTQSKSYQSRWNKNPGNYGIYKCNAFLLMYKYYTTELQLPADTSPTTEETENEDWLKPYNFMRSHWKEIEKYFSYKAKMYWRIYLNIDK
jgi:hypothetical protein